MIILALIKQLGRAYERHAVTPDPESFPNDKSIHLLRVLYLD